MTIDQLENDLAEALHRRADHAAEGMPSLADLHNRARTAVPEPSGRMGVPRLFVVGAAAAVALTATFGAWQLSRDDDITQRIDSAELPGEGNPVDPEPQPGLGNDDGGATDGDDATTGEGEISEGEQVDDEVYVFLDGSLLAVWGGSETSWRTLTAAEGQTIEVPTLQGIGDDLGAEVEAPAGLAVEACFIPGQEGFAFDDAAARRGVQVDVEGPRRPLLPRNVTEIAPQPAHEADVEAALTGRGLEPAITRVVQVDIDGDGTDEVLIEAGAMGADGGNPFESADQYSLVLLRRIGADGEVETLTVHEAFGADGQPLSRRSTIAAVADLTGDGVFELVTRDAYFEGVGGAVWSLGLQPAELIQNACSA